MLFRIRSLMGLAATLLLLTHLQGQVYLVGAHYYSSDSLGNSLGPYEYSTNQVSFALDLQLNLAGDIQSSSISYELNPGFNTFSFTWTNQQFPPGSEGGIGLFFSNTPASYNPASITGVAGHLVAVTPTDGSGTFIIPAINTLVRPYDLMWDSTGIFQTPYSGAISYQVGGATVEITAFSSSTSPDGSFTIAVSAVPEPSSWALIGIAGAAGVSCWYRKRSRRTLRYHN